MDEVAIRYNLFGCGVMTVDGGASIDMAPRAVVIGPPNHAWELTVSAGDQPMHVWSGSRPASRERLKVTVGVTSRAMMAIPPSARLLAMVVIPGVDHTG